MTQQELKSTFALASIYAFRMLGLFMILPIFSLYAHHFQHANALLIGLALGVYGLTQALLQIAFGMTSDRIGRKPVIIFGLILFVIGSIIAALSHSIYGIIIGRAVQGAGAVGSTLTALVADSTDEDNRLKAMSMIGMTIGLSFMGAMILGPLLNSLVGLSGIFWLTAILAGLGIVILMTCVPTPKNHLLHRDSEAVAGQFKKILSHPELLRLDFGIFCLHAMLTALFIAVPITLVKVTGIDAAHQWYVYLPVLLLSFIAMVPFVIIAESKRKMKPVFVGAVIVLTACEFLLGAFGHSIAMVCILLFLFFTAFTLLEATLPSLISKLAPAGSKGTAMGVYSSAQFFGIFVGGALGGVVFHHFGISSIFIFCGVLGVLWCITAMTMKKPTHLSSKVIAINSSDTPESLRQKLLAVPGVKDAMVYTDEKVAYLKVDRKVLDENQLKSFD